MNNRSIHILLFLSILFSCSKEDIDEPSINNENSDFISGVDISGYPEVSSYDHKFYDLNGDQNDFLTILKNNGVNTIRLRLWVNPSNEHSGFNEVQRFSQVLKSKGFKIWITPHYSDSWAHPGQQETPSQWQGLSFSELKDSVYEYTERIINEIQPEYIQIGNEVNTGMLFPHGEIINGNFEKFIELSNTVSSAVKTNSESAKVILHFAGIEGSDWFFNNINNTIDYDIIGLSYYPIHHGKSINNLKARLKSLSETHNKKIVIAETAYPFTLEWRDLTNNIVGSKEQLILPEYPATQEGQRKFIKQIKNSIKDTENGIGFCYWGAELIAWKGSQSTDASPWENQALFNFDNKALPVLKEFKKE
ncbi:glycoside hydrolase family 53 protein [Aureibacter tunicatorum]|uniref:Arabinogalactan endo-beta-1,4-galactanase n=1 Tax=Aureibacter tunicatorum TaxID=866807 RepID=A0AAE3XLC5_9BACT|nr:glycosyl hydrolase 53 family protein [Aureibacter tunicatorum]MDR6238567.1 arabinogalactan endo-1,4-beta-galactosidase [Aureibacter tunicatorum]BDD05502.1 hypothetical protein AUTU_29850 [Aureibacter tunicatorum]